MIVQSRVLPVEALKINLWSVRYEAAGDTAHRKFTAPVTAPADYANRHIVMAGALAIRNLATGQKDLLPAGRVWPFAGITGDRIDVVAQEPDTLWMCVRIKPGSGYRVDHSEETFDLGASQRRRAAQGDGGEDLPSALAYRDPVADAQPASGRDRELQRRRGRAVSCAR